MKFENIICASIICGSVLFATGSFEPKPEPTYATVHFDGGWKKLGVITEQRAFSEVSMTMDGKPFFTGTAKEFADMAGADPQFTEFKAGVVVVASYGVKWAGSESRFELTAKSETFESTAKSPLIIADTVLAVLDMELINKQALAAVAAESLTFSVPPRESPAVSRLIAAIAGLAK